MDLTAALLRFTARVPHVLVVPVPGRPDLHMDVEEAVRSRGWPEATGPADADVLVVAGGPGPQLRDVVEGLWQRIPAPRVRVEPVGDGTSAELEGALGAVPERLADARHARREAAAAAASEPPDDRSADDAADEDEHGDEHGDGEHGGGHHHHHGAMPLPGGLSMADVADDRDGLALDVLHLPLGPVLPEWPAGLVVDVELQGDVIASATARVLDAAEPRPPAPAPVSAAVRDLDALARMLAVAGWPGPAARARVLRDRLRRDEPPDGLAHLVRTVRRSRTLRLMLRGTASGAGVDVGDLLERRLGRIEARAAGKRVDDPVRPGPTDLGPRLAGAELAAARLLVAALDPDVDGAVAAAVPGPGLDEEER